MNYMATFHSFPQIMDALHIEENCRVYRENMRRNGRPICPHCGSISEHHYKHTQNGGQRDVQVQGLSL